MHGLENSGGRGQEEWETTREQVSNSLGIPWLKKKKIEQDIYQQNDNTDITKNKEKKKNHCSW